MSSLVVPTTLVSRRRVLAGALNSWRWLTVSSSTLISWRASTCVRQETSAACCPQKKVCACSRKWSRMGWAGRLSYEWKCTSNRARPSSLMWRRATRSSTSRSRWSVRSPTSSTIALVRRFTTSFSSRSLKTSSRWHRPRCTSLSALMRR